MVRSVKFIIEWLFYYLKEFLFLEAESCYIAQAGLKLLGCVILLPLASQSAGITGISRHTWPKRLLLFLFIYLFF